MIICEEFMDMLIAELHLHNYIKMQSSSIFGNGPLNVVANDSQRKHIQRTLTICLLNPSCVIINLSLYYFQNLFVRKDLL